MLASIFATIGMPLINGILDKALDAFRAYENKQISIEQLKDQLYAVMLDTIKAVEVAHAEALAKTYASFMDAMKTSPLMQRVWASVVLSQLFVLVWSQFAVPLLFAFGLLSSWKAGTTGEWAYLLVGACLGMGPMVLRSGPGAGNLAERLRGLLGK
jgi:hypothetical protein